MGSRNLCGDKRRLVNVLGITILTIADVKSCNMVAVGQGEVSKSAIVRNVGVDGNVVLSLGAKVDEKLSNSLLTRRVCAEGVNDPDFTWGDCGCESGGLGVARDKFHVLDTLTILTLC
jgi:hypothetical protein